MKNKLSIFLHTLAFSLFLSVASLSSYASHILHAHLTYTYDSGNTYTITLTVFGNCGAASSACFSTLSTAVPQICIYNGDSLITNINLVAQPSGTCSIVPTCAGDTTQCTSPSSSIPGEVSFIYSANYTFPYASSLWRLMYDGYMGASCAAGRAAAITNVAGGSVIQLTDTLNNAVGHNTNPTFNNIPAFFYCLDLHDSYYPGAIDPDGDSLLFFLVPAGNGSGGPTCSAGGVATYVAPFTAQNPLIDSPGSFAFSENTGDLLFTPNALQRALVVYNVEEYRHGTLVGTSMYEMIFLVMSCDSASCSTPAPCGTSAIPVVHNNNAVEIYPNPATNELTIKTEQGAYNSYTISNMLGKVVFQSQITGSQTLVNVNALSQGLYYITLKGSNGISVQKFVKE